MIRLWSPRSPTAPLASGAPYWYWLGGRPALDLVNTRRERWRRNVECLVSDRDAVDWLVAAKLLPARRSPRRAGCAREARELREAIDACVRAAVAGAPADARPRCADQRVARARGLVPGAGARPRRRAGARRAHAAAARRGARSALVALDAAQMLGDRRASASASASAARRRARPASTTARRAARRRWCSMQACGNVEKARRHRRERRWPHERRSSPASKASSPSPPRSPSPTARAARCATAASTSRSSSARCRSSRSGACWSTARSSRACRPPSRTRWRSAPATRASTSRPRWRCSGRSGASQSLIDISDEQARDDLARASVMALSFVAQSARGAGRPPVPQREVDKATSIPERFLIRWRGEADPDHVKAIDAYWISAAEHGMNASTFTARVIASTGADVAAALSGAVGALSGPLHGGAPARVLKMLDEVEAAGDADKWVKDALDRGERLMGFGHRVYRAEDPRAARAAAHLAGDRLRALRGRRGARGGRAGRAEGAQARPRARHQRRVLVGGRARPRRRPERRCSRACSPARAPRAGRRTSSSRSARGG